MHLPGGQLLFCDPVTAKRAVHLYAVLLLLPKALAGDVAEGVPESWLTGDRPPVCAQAPDTLLKPKSVPPRWVGRCCGDGAAWCCRQ